MSLSKYDPKECIKTWQISHNSAGLANNTQKNSESDHSPYSPLKLHLRPVLYRRDLHWIDACHKLCNKKCIHIINNINGALDHVS